MKHNRILHSIRALALTLIATVASLSAWAQTTQISLSGNATDGYYVNLPTKGTAATEGTANVLNLDAPYTFNIYGDNGKDAQYSSKYEGFLLITAPSGYAIRLSGTWDNLTPWDYLFIYNGSSVSYETETMYRSSISQTNNLDYTSTSNSILIHFQMDGNVYLSDNAYINLIATVAPKTDLSLAAIDLQTMYGYDNDNPVVIDYSVSLFGTTLTKGEHYTATIDGQSSTTASELGNHTLTITAIDGSGYTGSQSAIFKLGLMDWAFLQEQFTAGKNVRLSNDVAAASTDSHLLIPQGKSVVLDLNGHTINRNLSSPTDNGYVFRVEGGLTVCDNSTNQTGTIKGGNNTGDGGAFYVNYGSSLTFQGGQIKSNHAQNGGGIYSDYESSAVKIEGGKITNNTADENGGGVYLKGRINHFSMKGAPVIKNNTVDDDPNNLFLAAYNTYDGSGQYFISNSTVFTISDVLTQNASGAQIGITVEESGTNAIVMGWNKMGDARPTDFFVADRSSVYTFEAINAGYNDKRVYIKGVPHNVYTNVTGYGTVTPSASSVSFGDEVTLDVSYEADFHLESISVKDNNNNPIELRQTDTKTYAFTMPNIDVTVTATFASGAADMTWFDIQHAFDAGQNVTLTNDVIAPAGAARLELRRYNTATQTSENKNLYLDLNGHILSRNLSSPIEDGQVIFIEACKLTLKDSNPTATHSGTTLQGGILTGGNNGTTDYDGFGGGILLKATYYNSGLLIMEGGSIAGNKTTYAGAGVCVHADNNYNYAGFEMKGGKITDNAATGIDGSGGGVFLYEPSYNNYFAMTGGEISNNSAHIGGGISSNTNPTLIINNVEVPTLSISGGSIINNTVTDNTEEMGMGGGIFVYRSIALSGAPTISGNTCNGSDSNIYLDRYYDNGYKPCTINILGDLTNTTPIGVFVCDETKPQGGVARVITSNLGNYGSEDNFVSDQGYATCLENGEVAFYIMPSLTLHEAKVMGETKYVCTFYHSALAFQLSEGAKAYTVHLDGEGADAAAVFYRIGDDSDVIPADCPVVIISDTSTATLTPTTFTGTKDADNVLIATTTTKTYLREGSKYPYGLYKDNNGIIFIKLYESQYMEYPAGTVYLLK